MTLITSRQVEKMLDEYELIVNEILPKSYQNNDSGIIDEITHLLWLRDQLEQQKYKIRFILTLTLEEGTRLKPTKGFHQRLQDTDGRLYQMRHIIVKSYPEYANERERLDRPVKFWWWWLDQTERIEYSVRRN